MPFDLNPVEVRVLGALVEKELTTPDNYPLSLNALVSACNQKSNRDPVMALSESEAVEALDALMRRYLVRETGGAGSRVAKYAHQLSGSLFDERQLGRRDLALLNVLMLRGPQTVGELRTRTVRMADFDSLEAVESQLRELADRSDGPFVRELPPRAGQRERRYAHLFGATVETGQPPPTPPAQGSEHERIAALEQEMAELRGELAELQAAVQALRGE